jgi:hypothetical protein
MQNLSPSFNTALDVANTHKKHMTTDAEELGEKLSVGLAAHMAHMDPGGPMGRSLTQHRGTVLPGPAGRFIYRQHRAYKDSGQGCKAVRARTETGLGQLKKLCYSTQMQYVQNHIWYWGKTSKHVQGRQRCRGKSKGLLKLEQMTGLEPISDSYCGLLFQNPTYQCSGHLLPSPGTARHNRAHDREAYD